MASQARSRRSILCWVEARTNVWLHLWFMRAFRSHPGFEPVAFGFKQLLFYPRINRRGGTARWRVGIGDGLARRRDAVRRNLVRSMTGHHAMPPAVSKINHESDQQPDDQSIPVLSREREHQEQASENSQDWNQRNKRRAEGTVRVGICPAHDHHSAANDHEGEQRADSGHFSEYAQWYKSSH